MRGPLGSSQRHRKIAFSSQVTAVAVLVTTRTIVCVAGTLVIVIGRVGNLISHIASSQPLFHSHISGPGQREEVLRGELDFA